MRTISLFMNVSLDGYFEGPNHDISWARPDPDAMSSDMGDQFDALLFGHRTYDLFKQFWPTPQAMEQQPQFAKIINAKEKFVASHKPFDPGWSRVTVLSDDVIAQVKQLKSQPGKNILIFGSNTLVISLMEAGLLDEFQIRVNPVALGKGTSLFHGLSAQTNLALADTKPFKSGAILLTYKPAP